MGELTEEIYNRDEYQEIESEINDAINECLSYYRANYPALIPETKEFDCTFAALWGMAHGIGCPDYDGLYLPDVRLIQPKMFKKSQTYKKARKLCKKEGISLENIISVFLFRCPNCRKPIGIGIIKEEGNSYLAVFVRPHKPPKICTPYSVLGNEDNPAFWFLQSFNVGLILKQSKDTTNYFFSN